MTMIIKVQRYLAGNHPDRPWLMYDKDRKYEGEIPEAQIPDAIKKMMGNDLKFYAEAHIEVIGGENKFAIDKKIRPQDW